MYKNTWRLDPLEAIENGIQDRSFKRLYRVSKQFFNTLVTELEPLYTATYVKNNVGIGGRPRIPFSMRLGSFLFYIGRDTDFFTAAWMFGISEKSLTCIVDELCDVIGRRYNYTIFMPTDIASLTFLSEQWSRFSDLRGIVGSIDGSHFPINLPLSGEAEAYYNYKGWYSLLGVFIVDFQSRIMGMSLGHPGKLDDSTIVFQINID